MSERDESVRGSEGAAEPDVGPEVEPPKRRLRPGVLDERRDRLPIEELSDPDRLRSVLQSLLLVADRPLSPQQLVTFLGEGHVEPGAVAAALDGWQRELDAAASGVRVVRLGGGYRLRTDPQNAPWVQAFTARRPVRLSRAALETLAIVAYRQPITRSEVDDVRGVDSSVVLRSLLEKDLLRIAGRKEEPGRPMLYATSRRFLEVFGLASLADLPSLREFGELAIGEQEQLFRDHALLDDDGADDGERGDDDAP